MEMEKEEATFDASMFLEGCGKIPQELTMEKATPTATDSPYVTRKEYEYLMWRVHDLSCRQQEMIRLSPSVTRKEYEHLMWIVDDLSQRQEKMWRLLQNGSDSCPIRRIQYNHLLSVVQRHDDILALLHNEYEPAGGGFLSIVGRLERRFGRLIAVRLTERSLLAFTLGPAAIVVFCYLTGIKTAQMLLDEKLKEIPGKVDVLQSGLDKLKEIPERVDVLAVLLNEKIPEKVDVLQSRLDKLEKIPRRVDVLPDEKLMKTPEKVDVLESRLDKVEVRVVRLLKPAKVVPLSPPMSPLHAFARKCMDRVKANSELLSASRWDP